MSDRWFAVGAFAGTPLAPHADILFDRDGIDRDLLLETDVFLAAPDDPGRAALPPRLLVTDRPLDAAELERRLACSGGGDFLSSLGHDIANLFAPLIEYRHLSPATVSSRIERGIRLGRQVNLAGHLLQRDLSLDAPIPADELLHRLIAAARKEKIAVGLERRGNGSFDTVPERLADPFIQEIVLNWAMHARGVEHVTLDTGSRAIVFANRTDYRFPYTRLKAVLRRPYQKFGNTGGNGLGLFLTGLIAHAGGFSWDIAAHDGTFSLSCSFGA